MTGSLSERLKLFPRNRTKTHAIAGMQQRRWIFGGIEKLQRSAADQIPPARRTQRINSRLRTADSNRPGRNFFARHIAPRRRQILRQPCQKRKTRNEPNAGHSIFACAVKIDDFARGKGCMFGYAVQVEPKFRIVADGNFDQTRTTCLASAAMMPGSRSNRFSNSCRELAKNSIRRAIRLENGDRIKEDRNASVSRRKFHHARNRRALKQLKYPKHFVQCFFRRILKLVAH